MLVKPDVALPHQGVLKATFGPALTQPPPNSLSLARKATVLLCRFSGHFDDLFHS